MKLTKERVWWLEQFGEGWSIGRPNCIGIKRWAAHTDALVKMGHLEADGHGMYRVTDAGRAALSPQGSKSE